MTRSTGIGSIAQRVAFGAAFIVAAGVPATRAWGGAVALSGTYEGKLTCSGLRNGVPFAEKTAYTAENPVLASDIGAATVLELPPLGRFAVVGESNLQKPGHSLQGGIGCPFSLALDGAHMILLNAKVKGDAVTLKGTLVRLDDAGNTAASCKISLKRVDATDPFIVCPE